MGDTWAVGEDVARIEPLAGGVANDVWSERIHGQIAVGRDAEQRGLGSSDVKHASSMAIPITPATSA